MSDAMESLNGLIVPLAGTALLLPNVAVAELSAYRQHEPAPSGAANWFAGWMRWRDQRIAVLDPAPLMGLTGDTESPRQQALVLNAIGQRQGVSFFALRITAIPRSRKILRGDISPLDAQPALPGILQQVQLADRAQPLLIPDLQALEQLLAEQGAFAAVA